MTARDADYEALQARNRALEVELLEANETLDAIRNGEVDAVVVGGPDGQIIYTLENADRPYRVLVEQMREGAATLSGDGTILYCNRSFTELISEHAGEVVGERIFDFVAEHAKLEALFAEATTAGQSTELTMLAPLGDPIPVNFSIVELAVEDGADRMLCVIVTDLRQNYERAREITDANRRLAAEITDRTRVEQSLAVALDAADMGSWDLDLETLTAIRSPRHDAIFGYEQLLPSWTLEHALSHFVPEDREAAAEAFQSSEQTGRVDFERRIKRVNDGAIRWLHVRGRTFHQDGKADRMAGIVVDNTERKLIDEQLRQGQKMEAIGQLTGGIAHDFNNLLMIIGGSLEALSRRITLDERAQKLFDAARVGVERGAKLNEQLLAFARRQDMHEDVVLLTDLVPTFETLLDRAIGEAVRLEIRLASDLWWCKTDPHQLETAILNLSINARDAMANNGSIVLATANVSMTQQEADRFEAMAGDYVVVSVSDTGCGLGPETAARVFEPFFTTKEIGKGTGLGLSQVYGFARQSGGFARFESEVGRGTTVSLYLPKTEAGAAAKTMTAIIPAQRVADGVVLLVEDDADVRTAASAMFEDLGYRVVAAESGADALSIIESVSPIDLVFSDIIMSSGMTGVELARVVRAKNPELPILLTSGYTAQKILPTGIDGDLPLLRKPYTLAQLADAIDQIEKR